MYLLMMVAGHPNCLILMRSGWWCPISATDLEILFYTVDDSFTMGLERVGVEMISLIMNHLIERS